MTDVYLGIGHGITPTGLYDPGAIAPKGTQEHVLASAVVAAAAGGLARSKVSAIVEQGYNSHGDPIDPNYVGSTNAANAAKVKRAVEVHFDCSTCVHGYAGQYSGSKSLALSKAIAARFTAMGLPLASNSQVDRSGTLYFLDHTTMPALIPEMTVVADDITAVTLTTMGAAIAAGICDDLGVPYVEEDDMGIGNDYFQALSDGGVTSAAFRDNEAYIEGYRNGRADIPFPTKLLGNVHAVNGFVDGQAQRTSLGLPVTQPVPK